MTVLWGLTSGDGPFFIAIFVQWILTWVVINCAVEIVHKQKTVAALKSKEKNSELKK